MVAVEALLVAAIFKLIENIGIYILKKNVNQNGVRTTPEESQNGVRTTPEELKNLLTELNRIKVDAEGAQIEDRSLQLRLDELREAVYDAEDLLYRIELKRRDKDINNLKTVSDRFNNIVAHKKDFSKLPNHPPVAKTSRWTTSKPTAPRLFGRDEEKKHLLKLVGTDDDGKSKSNFKLIAIVGMGGLGKTALAQHVFNDESIKKRFENLTVWVCVTHSHNVDLTWKTNKEVLHKLKSNPDVTYTPGGLNRNQELLEKRLKGKRFLIVLDDVWKLEPEEWQKLCAPFRSASEGSRFILTTRNPRLVSRLPAIQTVSLGEIQRSHYLKLFQRRAFGDGANPTNYPKKLVSIGTKIAKRLKGSPLAAETVGAELRSKLDDKHWSKVRDSRLCSIEQGEYGIIPSLRLTYMHLPARLKQCFAFGALFPLNYVFESPQSLVSMWIAQGFVQSRDTGMDYFHELLDISFFQRAEQEDKNRYVINALLHEVAWSVSNTEYCVIDNKKPVPIPEKLRHLCVVGNTLPDVCKDINKMERLRSLVLLGDFNFNNNNRGLFSKLKSLRLLIISGRKDKLPSTIIDNLKHLPYCQVTPKTVSTRAEIGFSRYHSSDADTKLHSDPTQINRRRQQQDQPGTSNRDRMSGFPTKWPSLSK